MRVTLSPVIRVTVRGVPAGVVTEALSGADPVAADTGEVAMRTVRAAARAMGPCRRKVPCKKFLPKMDITLKKNKCHDQEQIGEGQ
jgi:hypothetical protein